MLKIQKKDVGWKVVTDEETYYIGEFGGDGCCEGVIYKDENAFKTGRGVCYVNEYGFENSEENAGILFEMSAKQAIAEDIVGNSYIATNGYTRKDFEDIVVAYGYNKKMARALFEGCWWQSPETYIEEWDE